MEKRKETRTAAFISAWLPVLVWMAVIFFFSCESAAVSDTRSDAVAGFLGRLFNILQENILFPQITFLVRKTAHFLEYAILAILIYRASEKTCLSKPMLIAVLFSFAYAATDEFHQLFIDGRSAQIRDVFLDGAGAFCGAAVFKFSLIIKRKQSN